jgi:hydrogenase expression/formation protein HypE
MPDPRDARLEALERIEAHQRRKVRLRDERITLAHGAGGKATQTLVEAVFLEAFRNPLLEPLEDQAVFAVKGSDLAFTTDSYVVSPLFFPGGDIGALAVNGTVNDLAVSGARPLHLSAGSSSRRASRSRTCAGSPRRWRGRRRGRRHDRHRRHEGGRARQG